MDFARRVFLVGPNASGKSNVLEAIRFLRRLVTGIGGGLASAVDQLDGITQIRSHWARNPSNVAIEVSVGSGDDPNLWVYELVLSHQGQKDRVPIVIKEKIIHKSRVLLNRPTADDKEDKELLKQTHIEQSATNAKFRALADFFRTIQYMHIVPQLVREPERRERQLEDPYGGDFLERLAKEGAKKRAGRLNRIVTALRIAVPNLGELKLEQDKKGIWHLRGRFKNWRGHGAWQNERALSDGTLRLLGLLYLLQEPGGPLLLEEPEQSLHPAVARQIPRMLAKMQARSGRQVIITTHSPDLLADHGIGLHEVQLLQPSGEGTRAERATSLTKDLKKLLSTGSTIGEIVLPKVQPVDVKQLSLKI